MRPRVIKVPAGWPEEAMKLKRYLRHGDMTKIARSARYTPEYTCDVINGKRYVERIVQVFRALAEKRKRERVQALEEIGLL